MPVPLEIFCCYAREDQEMLERLKKHLMPLQRNGQITIWSDTNLSAGAEWKKELHRHLESANIILLLISPDFMVSDYCYSTEMKRAIERHDQGSAHVIPILLRFVHWDSAPFAKLQMIPTNTRPISSWPDHDEAFDNITKQIVRVISELESKQVFTEMDVHASMEHNQEIASYKQDQYAKPTIQSFHPLPSYDTLPLFGDGIYPPGLPSSPTLVWSPDSSILAFNNTLHTFSFWNLTASMYTATFTSPYFVSSLAWSPDGSIMASSGGRSPIRFWNLNTHEPTDLIGSHSRELAWSPNGSLLASLTDTSIELWNPNTHELVTILQYKHSESVHMFVWSPNSSLLASTHGSIIRFWNPNTGEPISTITVDKGGAACIAWSPDSSLLASASVWNRNIHLWNPNTGKLVSTLIPPDENKTNSLVWSPDGSTLAAACSGSSGGTIHIWNPSTCTLVAVLHYDQPGVNNLAWSPNGFHPASAPGDNYHSIRLWRIT